MQFIFRIWYIFFQAQGGESLPTCVPMPRIAALAMWMILAFPAVALPAGPEIFLLEEPESYLVIEKL